MVGAAFTPAAFRSGPSPSSVAAARGSRVQIARYAVVPLSTPPTTGREHISHAKFYTWPRELRPETAPGSHASLHAKCAVADEQRLLVSSANLTDYAFTKNIELGLLVEGGNVPGRAQAHLEALFANRILQLTKPMM